MTDTYVEWSFECPAGETMKTFYSTYMITGNPERFWNFSCESISHEVNLTSCEWSNYANDFREHIHFQCYNDGIIAGVSSYYETSKDDRRFKFLCCLPGDYVAHACYYTPFVNQPGKIFSYRLLDHWYLRGVNADFRTTPVVDRLFYFNVCRLDRIEETSVCL
ncbi:hypothetical protein Btru_066490 [Bulinus truncatus]|nr:hypothetical protein Btru_066490 [Bulinus truncatus]